MSELPDNYSLNYLVYSASTSITEQEKIWDMDYAEVIKRAMFRKFDNYIEHEINEFCKSRGNN